MTKWQHARKIRNRRRQGAERVIKDFSEEGTSELVRNSKLCKNMKGEWHAMEKLRRINISLALGEKECC